MDNDCTANGAIVGVVGAGVMGCGVAYELARHGYAVVLVDVSEKAVAKAASTIVNEARLAVLLKVDLTNPACLLERITVTTDYGALAAAEVIVENVVERLDVKTAVHKRLASVCVDARLVAINTSTIAIGTLASLWPAPDRVVGIHFMNPVFLKPVVELVRGAQTSDSCHAAALEFLRTIEKDAVTVRDSPGFVSNRVLMLTLNESIRVVEEGVAEAADVDRIFKSCFGHQMGPIETADLIGLDTVMLSLESLEHVTGDKRFEPSLLLREKVAEGCTGRKTGRGFYTYD